jgi:PAS domain S-box-containing protein
MPGYLSGGSVMGQRVNEFDWSRTPIGAVNSWPQSLRSALSICLNSNFPIAIYWGRELTLIYNDAWSSIPGNKHPWALGRAAREVWPDIWNDIEPQFDKAFSGYAGGSKDALLPMQRHGYTEECYFDFTFTPVYGENGKVDGVFNAVIETTYRVINERRTAFLKNFTLHITAAQTVDQVEELAIQLLKAGPADIPFALLYNFQNEHFVLNGTTFQNDSLEICDPRHWPLDQILESGQPLHINDLKVYFTAVPKGYWEEEPTEAFIVPIKSGTRPLKNVLVCGISARRKFDSDYRVFIESIVAAIVTALNNIYSLEEERQKAASLAVLDKAKTTFFSNISHEFRTPLTLLLGPIEDAMNDPSTTTRNKARMDVAYRNALRMQKLVNTLLQFSRLEAGRVQARFSRVDICSLTREQAGSFRSAIEKAGMQLVLTCSEIRQEVYVDVEMWEKIVMNLVSNAFKYSKQGCITVSITEADRSVKLSVSDTGIGIPADQLQKIFDRFHRVDNVEGRSQEGTGIGLAMVKELVHLHNGTITVESRPGEGSTFTVTIPGGKEHLPADKIDDTVAPISVSHQADAYIQEAMKWLPEDEQENSELHDIMLDEGFQKYVSPATKARVLIADDNADMREYLQRLLRNYYEVLTATDGEDAFTKALKYKPQLIISDIMMPRQDGFGLLNNIRAHAVTKNTPVIFLSARAGEEAKVEGLDAGADDYLVKPFSSKELLARVEANIRLAKNRQAAENNLRSVIMQSPVATTLLRGPSFIIDIVNEKGLEVWGRRYHEVINLPIAQALPEVEQQGFVKLLEQVYNTGVPFNGDEVPVDLMRFGRHETIYLNFIYTPVRDEENRVYGVLGIGVDVTAQVIARKKIEQSESKLKEMANAMPQLVWVTNSEGQVTYFNDRLSEYAGAQKLPNGYWLWQGLVHDDDLVRTQQLWERAVAAGDAFQFEHRIQMKDGTYRWHLTRGVPHKDREHGTVQWFGTTTNVHITKEQATLLEQQVQARTQELKELNLSLQKSNQELQQFAHVTSHDLKEPLRKIKTFLGRIVDDDRTYLSDISKVYAAKVNAAADRMKAMIEGVLNYSTIEAEQQELERVDLTEVVQQIEADLELEISRKSATLKYGRLPIIEGASVLFYQLFYNLLNNSLKFSQPDVLPHIAIDHTLVKRDGREWAEITVIDNGIGFEQQFSEKIFETFSRLNSKDRFEGTGIGLSLCKRIVERYDGTIKAMGEPGKGARFLITLPLHQTKASH